MHLLLLDERENRIVLSLYLFFDSNYFKKRMMPYLTHMFMCGKESGDWLFGKENEDKFIQLNNAINAERFR